MNLFLDTEFTDFQGELISIAIVDEDADKKLYIELEDVNWGKASPFVWAHVIPKLEHPHRPRLTRRAASIALDKYFKQFDTINIVADWPADFVHLCELMEPTSGGAMIKTPKMFTMQLVRNLDSSPVFPHHALSDAMALRKAWVTKEYSY